MTAPRCPLCSPNDYRVGKHEKGRWPVLNKHGRVVRLFATLHEAEQWILEQGEPR